jgi:hypothetical protein
MSVYVAEAGGLWVSETDKSEAVRSATVQLVTAESCCSCDVQNDAWRFAPVLIQHCAAITFQSCAVYVVLYRAPTTTSEISKAKS